MAQFDQRFFTMAPKVITGIFLEYQQGRPMMDQIFNEREVGDYVYQYHLWGQVGHMTEKVGPGDEPDDNSVQYEERTGRAYEYAESATISEREIRSVSDIRPVLADNAAAIAKGLMVRREYEGIKTLLDLNPHSPLSGEGMPDPISTGEPWSSKSTDIFGQIADAKNAIRKTAFMEADALIISPDDLTNIMKHPDFRQYQLSGNVFGQEILRNGSVGRIHGLDVFVHNMVINTSEQLGKPKLPFPGEPGTRDNEVEAMLQNKAIMIARTNDFGYRSRVMSFYTDVEYLKSRRSTRIYAGESYGYTIGRPTQVVHINTDGT